MNELNSVYGHVVLVDVKFILINVSYELISI